MNNYEYFYDHTYETQLPTSYDFISADLYPTPDDDSLLLTLNTMLTDQYKANPNSVNPLHVASLIPFFAGFGHYMWTYE